MSATPRATPVVRPPQQEVRSGSFAERRRLVAPILLVATGGEWELEAGELIIGRDPAANVVLSDPLVSRFHARVAVDRSGHVVLDDLHSANGIFLNGQKLTLPSSPLGEGDRLLIGTTEFSVFGLRVSSMVRLERPVPSTLNLVRADSPQSIHDAPAGNQAAIDRRRRVAVTGRTDAIDLVGQFAEQLMGAGHSLEAVRVLAEHLGNLMKGASAGLSVPSRILDSATQCALKLFDWTERGVWAAYVLELHIACQQVPSDESLQAIMSTPGAKDALDSGLVGYFVKTIEQRAEPPSIEERLRLRRLERFACVRRSQPPTASD